ncbi:MAG: helix-turn-helix domain-containing protein [Actinomycetota bacterium]|nr:helix-turn-helix domain-containing protein [Actinomycetota bacterium]
MARRAGQPTARSWLLAILLRKLRVAAVLSNAEVAKATGMPSSRISRIEAAEYGIYRDALEKLLDLYQVSRSHRVLLLDIARHAEERGWLQMHSDATLPEDWQAWTELEAGATEVFNYETLLIPGLLQTPEYARAIIREINSDLSESEIDKLTTSRIARQALLSRAHPFNLHVIIEESALRRPVGHADAWVRQLQHLISSATHPNILIRVVPTDAGAHAGLHGPFVILDYGDDIRLVHLENKTTNLFLDEEEQIEVYTQIWNRLEAVAYNVEKSVDFISAIATQESREN